MNVNNHSRSINIDDERDSMFASLPKEEHEETTLKDMKRLWKETFHDTDTYIDRIYDNYYDNRFCLIRKNEKGEVIASLTGIKYKFHVNGIIHDALYLCGLSTISTERGKGIMGELMKEIEEIALTQNISILCLIPADERLRKYYARKGYESILSNRKMRISLTNWPIFKPSLNENFSDIRLSKLNILADEYSLEKENNHEIDDIAKTAEILEKEYFGDNYMQHNSKDFKLICEESMESNGTVVVMRDNDTHHIVGIAFLDKILISESKTRAHELELKNGKAADKIESEVSELRRIKYLVGISTDIVVLLIWKLLSENSKEIFELRLPAGDPIWQYLLAFEKKGIDEAYGMVKILEPTTERSQEKESSPNSEFSENQKLSTPVPSPSKFSIFRNSNISFGMLLD